MITLEKRLRRYCKEFKNIENYDEAVQSTELYVLHHRKGIETLDDGTVVRRSRKELKELGLYWHRPSEELIFLTHNEHVSIHSKGDRNCMYGIRGDKHPWYGKKMTTEQRAKMSAREIGEKNHAWKGDLASDHAKYLREWRRKRREASSISG